METAAWNAGRIVKSVRLLAGHQVAPPPPLLALLADTIRRGCSDLAGPPAGLCTKGVSSAEDDSNRGDGRQIPGIDGRRMWKQ